MKRRKLPIGIQTLREIREDDCYYVDKTPLALKMIREGKSYFLSRPRRFGKSLFLDTLNELFAGNAVLFQGLYAEKNWNWSIKYPVIRLSFGSGKWQSSQYFTDRVDDILLENASRLKINTASKTSDGRFAELITTAHEKYGQRTVVLIDEYDKPILDNLGEPDIARQMRDGLRSLYSVIKDADAHIKFAFLTGVSKFSKVSLFSGLNNLQDITLSSDYSAICGYTETDVTEIFAPELEGLEREQIRRWYNGYNWRGERVYNPFDLLLLFKERIFHPYWFETGTPTFLTEQLLKKRFFAPQLSRLQTSASLLGSFEIEQISPEALLFQTGYLTIGSIQNENGLERITLCYPNREVQISLSQAFGQALVNSGTGQIQNVFRLQDLLSANDFTGMKDLFQAFFASIPHDWYRNNTIAHYEGFYASVFYTYFASLGLDVIPEDISNKGCIDMTVIYNSNIYIFEFKVVEDAPQGKAMAQILARDYAAKYRARGLPIHLIGVEFSKAEKNVVGFEVESDGKVD